MSLVSSCTQEDTEPIEAVVCLVAFGMQSRPWSAFRAFLTKPDLGWHFLTVRGSYFASASLSYDAHVKQHQLQNPTWSDNDGFSPVQAIEIEKSIFSN
jgi:hypothetical protein